MLRRRVIPLVSLAVMALLAGVMTTSTRAQPASPKAPTSQDVGKKLLDSPAANFLTSPALAAVKMAASGNLNFSQQPARESEGAGPAALQRQIPPTAKKPSTFKNVQVNAAGADTNQLDQTTQSETAIAVAGSNVVVGFNDSQRTLLVLTAGSSLSGYAFSSDRGTTWQDGGTIPNRPGDVNLGDPWLASDKAGNFYYSTLYISSRPNRFGLDIGVAKSTDGGRTFSAPVMADTNATDLGFYLGDKDAIAAGVGAGGKGEALYVAWDDFVFDPATFIFTSGLPVSRSTDGGGTWTVVYADRIPLSGPGCSFQQYIGAMPLVDTSGTVYLAAERLFTENPNCVFPAPVKREIDSFVSKDGGQTWSSRSVISAVTSSTPDGFAFVVGPGKVIRNLELPTLGFTKGTLYAAWNDGAGGSSQVRVASSKDGVSWTQSAAVTTGPEDHLQPAMTADAQGVHILYYQINGDDTLDVYISNSPNGKNFSAGRVTTQSFPGVFTFPQFDPIIAFGYMGDYIAQATDGSRQYFAWGDNRNTIVNFLQPSGRNDPDVFYSSQTSE